MFKKSKSFASEMLYKSFKAAKCKTSLKFVRTRIMLMKNKKGIQVKQMRRDMAMLLAAGKDQTALIRVEHLIREEKNLSAYELIDIYCELIMARLPIIESQKNCPVDLKEAISSVLFASSRCADIPEIIDVRKQFETKYGKEFITAALEVRPGCGVSCLLVEKLSAMAPDMVTKMKVLTSIAEEFNIKWDTKPFEDQNQISSDDLLAGPKTFASANQMPMESPNANFSPVPSPRRINEQSYRMSHTDMVNKRPSLKASSMSRTNITSVPFTESNSRISDNRESRSSWEEVNLAFGAESASLNQQNWNMEFKDASSAAQAAAESAERASIAARTAAELARRESASYNEIKHNIKESVHTLYNETKHPRESVMEAEDRNTDEVVPDRSGKVGRRIYANDTTVIRSFSYSPSYSHEVSSYDEVSEVNKDEGGPCGYAQQSFSDAKFSDHNCNVHDGLVTVNTLNDDSRRDSNILKHLNSRIGDGEEICGSSPGVVISDYGSDTNDQLVSKGYSRENLCASSPNQGEEVSHSFSGNNHLSTKLQGSGFVVKDLRSLQLPFVSEPQFAESFETIEEGNHPSHAKSTFRMTSALPDIDFSDLSNGSTTKEKDGLSLGSLTGGFKNKGFPRPPYLIRDILPDTSVPSNQSLVHTTALDESVSGREKSSASFEASYQAASYDQEPHLHGCMPNARPSGVFPDLTNKKLEGLERHYSVEGRGHGGESSPTLNRSGRNASDIEKQTVSHQSKASTNTTNWGIYLEKKSSSKSFLPEHSPMTPSNSESSVHKDNLNKLQVNTDGPKVPSRESSFKSVSHVHPKLPDYDTIVAHFQALRANRR
ncbi:hypothetical protein J5N97_019352 [Dioscorea zingiberensis]|uniref:IST1-like protein n=1 Tax=Dioscorea zingiberensis TaxID=325984 RepID=A0A9D5CES8_9LILI|nr:hypothetical protein J5N97_019352 [Dioscorea zingiberensis]